MWALFESLPGPLFMAGLGHLARYCSSVNHYHMWLNMFIKFVEIMYLLTRTCVHGISDQRYSIVCSMKIFISLMYLSSHP